MNRPLVRTAVKFFVDGDESTTFDTQEEADEHAIVVHVASMLQKEFGTAEDWIDVARFVMKHWLVRERME